MTDTDFNALDLVANGVGSAVGNGVVWWVDRKSTALRDAMSTV